MVGNFQRIEISYHELFAVFLHESSSSTHFIPIQTIGFKVFLFPGESERNDCLIMLIAFQNFIIIIIISYAFNIRDPNTYGMYQICIKNKEIKFKLNKSKIIFLSTRAADPIIFLTS